MKVQTRKKSSKLACYATSLGMLAGAFSGAQLAQAADPVTFVYAVPAVAQNVDPGMWDGDPGRWTKWDQGSSLVTYDPAAVDGNGCNDLATIKDIKPELAESWELSADRTYYTFKLRDATSSAGNKLTSEDVRWSFERQKALSGVSRNMYFTQAKYAKEGTIEIVDDRTFRLRLEKPTSMDLPIHTIGAFAMGIYDSKEAKSHATDSDPWATKWLASNTANYGPWKVERFDPGNEVVYAKNTNYWGQRGNIDRLVIRGIPESSTRLQLLQAGQIDFAARLTFDEYNSLANARGVKVEQCLSPNRDTLMMQIADKRFSDPRVRKAVSYAINRDALAKTAYRGFATPSVTSLPVGYSSPSSGETLRHDPAMARKLLAEAGVPSGFEATMMIHSSRPGPHAEQVAVQLQSQLAAVGLKWRIQVASSAAEFASRYQERKYETVLNLDPPAVADPLYTLVNYNATTAAQNTHGYSNKEYDALVEELATVLDLGPARDEILKKIDKVVMDTMPMVYLVDRKYVHAYRNNIEGFFNAPNGEVYAVYITKK